MNKSVTYVVAGFLLIIVGLFGAREGDYIPVEYLDMVGVEPSYSCDVPTIKGNITPNGKIYHVPGGTFYDRTDVEPEKGQRLFCTEADAEAAGWRKSKK